MNKCISTLLFFFFIFNLVAQEESQSISKQSFHIKTIRIENGDTVITENSYESDGNGELIILDTINFGYSDMMFNLDQLNQAFYDNAFDRAYQDMMLNLNEIIEQFNNNTSDFFNGFPEFYFSDTLNNDSIINNFYNRYLQTDTSYQKEGKERKPGINSNNLQLEYNKNLQKKRIVREIYITKSDTIGKRKKWSIKGFQIMANSPEAYINLIFNLNSKHESTIIISNSSGTQIISEELPRGQGQFTRHIDVSSFPSGVYYIEVRQGKATKTTRIIIQ